MCLPECLCNSVDQVLKKTGSPQAEGNNTGVQQGATMRGGGTIRPKYRGTMRENDAREPTGGHDAGEPGGVHDAGEPAGGHDAGEPAGGNDAREPAGGHNTGGP